MLLTPGVPVSIGGEGCGFAGGFGMEVAPLEEGVVVIICLARGARIIRLPVTWHLEVIDNEIHVPLYNPHNQKVSTT